MLRQALFLLFLYGISSSTGRPQNDVAEAREEIQRDRMKESQVGANGSGDAFADRGEPVLSNSMLDPKAKRPSLLRVIRHGFLVPQGTGVTAAHPKSAAGAREVKDPSKLTDFYEYLRNPGMAESSVTSPTLHLNKNEAEGGVTKTEVFPAAAVVVSTFNKDGTLKSRVTHFRPSAGLAAPFPWIPSGPSVHQTGPGPEVAPWGPSSTTSFNQGQKINWPLAGYFPIMINDPLLAAYNGFTSSVYNTFSTVEEYGPEADSCRRKEQAEKIKNVRKDIAAEFDEIRLNADLKLVKSTTEKIVDPDEYSNIFDEVVVEVEKPRSVIKTDKKKGRKARDTTGIVLNFKNGDRVNLEVDRPTSKSAVFLPAEPEERTRAHTVMLVNPPPLSSISRPSHTGFNIKKKGSKPQKPDKEGNEEASEEVGEESEDAASQGTPTDGVAISPPPDGASVAEAKPVGLAIAGPGGVAAAKPQGTAVAGPGGLAIARPIGTAIAGVEVEGNIPIGGQHKNKKKKPKQDPEKADDQADAELHYVGGLTGPIGNPQPNTKDFGPSITAKSRSQDNLIFQGKFNPDGYQLKLAEQDGKYGFYPVVVTPVRVTDRIQKRMDAPTFFHGLLGNRAIQPQGQRSQIYPNFYY